MTPLPLNSFELKPTTIDIDIIFGAPARRPSDADNTIALWTLRAKEVVFWLLRNVDMARKTERVCPHRTRDTLVILTLTLMRLLMVITKRTVGRSRSRNVFFVVPAKAIMPSTPRRAGRSMTPHAAGAADAVQVPDSILQSHCLNVIVIGLVIVVVAAVIFRSAKHGWVEDSSFPL